MGRAGMARRYERRPGVRAKIRPSRGGGLFGAIRRSPFNLLHRAQSATGLSRRTQVVSRGQEAPQEFGTIVKTWSAGGQQFYMNSQGLMGTRKSNGVWRTWRPRRHVVVSSNPRLGTFLRAYGRLDTMAKRFQKKMPRKSSGSSKTKPHSHGKGGGTDIIQVG